MGVLCSETHLRDYGIHCSHKFGKILVHILLETHASRIMFTSLVTSQQQGSQVFAEVVLTEV